MLTGPVINATLPMLPRQATWREYDWPLPPRSSSLDGYIQNCTQLSRVPRSDVPVWDARSGRMVSRAEYNGLRRQRRSYHRCSSGLRLPGEYRFLTLTHSPEAKRLGLDIRASFRALVMRLRRRRVLTGYIRVLEFTQAGEPHLHVLLRGGYICQVLLSRAWAEIHHSPIVDIRAVRSPRGAAGYLGKYLVKDPLSRYSWSWDWVWKGFVGDWKMLCRVKLGQGWPMEKVLGQWLLFLDFSAWSSDNLRYYLRSVSFAK